MRDQIGGNRYTFANSESGQELCAGVQYLNLQAACDAAQRHANRLGVVVSYWDDRAPSDAYECEPEAQP